jgi:predicted Zn-dependent peptidase
MYKLTTLKNGLTLITVDLPYLNSVTSLVAVGAGARYENPHNFGVSHFLEHMAFKGTKKYPNAEVISTLVDSMGAINNAATGHESTVYWIKSSAKNVATSVDVLSSMMTEMLLEENEIEKEKGVIIEEIKMIRDIPARYIWKLYFDLQFKNHPLSNEISGSEESVTAMQHSHFMEYISSFYVPSNMCVAVVGKLPKNIEELVEDKFASLRSDKKIEFQRVNIPDQDAPRVNVFEKQVDQVQLVLGTAGYDRHDDKRYAARILATILGEGMSSRLFLEVREKRGLAYATAADYDYFKDTGCFVCYAGLRTSKAEEGLHVMLGELEKMKTVVVTSEELEKAKEMIRGRLALRMESTNFLAEMYGTEYVLEREIESVEEFLEKIDQVTAEDVQNVAQELFQKNRYNLQIIGPFKDEDKFAKLLT